MPMPVSLANLIVSDKKKWNTSALSKLPICFPVVRLVTTTDPTVDTWPPEYPDEDNLYN
jgi:hypothetical protein